MKTVRVYAVTVSIDEEQISEDEFFKHLQDRIEQATCEVPAVLISFAEMRNDFAS